MTTTITIQTSEHPVELSVSNQYVAEDGEGNAVRSGWSNASEFVPAHSTRTIHISDRATANINELPKDATGLKVYNEATLTSAQVG